MKGPTGVHGFARTWRKAVGFRFDGNGVPCKAPSWTDEFRWDGWVYLFRKDGWLHLAYEESAAADRVREHLPLAFSHPPIKDAHPRIFSKRILRLILDKGVRGGIWHCDPPGNFREPVGLADLLAGVLEKDETKGIIVKDVRVEFERLGDSWEADPGDERHFGRRRGNPVVVFDGRIRIWSPLELHAVDINGVFVHGFQRVGTWQQAELTDWQQATIVGQKGMA